MTSLPTPLATAPRIQSIDLLRGLVMVLMALDHTRDFLHAEAFTRDPLDLATTTPALFLTRWVTHFCAPVFVLLAGTSAWLQGRRKTVAERAGFLVRRGLWLIVVELFVIGFAWTFDPTYTCLILQVIWAIGISMVLLGLLLRLPYAALLGLGAVLVGGHNLLDAVPATHDGFVWDLLRNGDFARLPLGHGHTLVIIYPFVPWLGLMLLGHCLGRVYDADVDTARRRRFLLGAGTAALALFVVLRATNVYGDPEPWVPQSGWLDSLLAFVDTDKYPPSLAYSCMTLGPALLLLAVTENADGRVARFFLTFGRVPLFFYIAHFYLLHLARMVLFLLQGHAFDEPTPGVFGIPFRFLVVGEGVSLVATWGLWLALVFGLYLPCRWFAGVKRRSTRWWLAYL